MEDIKIKCKIDDIGATTTRKEFLRGFLSKQPMTYFMDGKEQAKAKTNRSFSDLLALTKHRFPVSSLNSVIRIVAELNREGVCYLVWCTQIEKFVVRGGMNSKTQLPFITNYSVKYYKNKTGVDGISYEYLMATRKEVELTKK